MVGAKEWRTILKNAEKFGAKVIAVGDDCQFKPISSGDCFNPAESARSSLPRGNRDSSDNLQQVLSSYSVTSSPASGRPA